MIIRMIWPPLCSSLPLQMVICKEDGSTDDQKQGDEGAGIVANDHLDDLVFSISLQMVTCNEDCPPNDQNQRDGEAQIVANDHLDDLASSVLFCSFANKRFALFTWSSLDLITFLYNQQGYDEGAIRLALKRFLERQCGGNIDQYIAGCALQFFVLLPEEM